MSKAGIAQLVQLPGVWRGGELAHAAQPTIATGHDALDRELPGGGWPTGTLTEVLHDASGIGEVAFLAGALARAAGPRLIAWIHAPYLPYAPALAQAGIPLEQCLVVRPVHREDALWAAEQALKSGACGAVLMWLPQEVGSRRHDEYAWLRRLQMAAEAGRSLAVFFRPTAAEGASTPAHLRVVLSREGEALHVRIPKRRGPPLVHPIALTLAGRPASRARAPQRAATKTPQQPPLPVTASGGPRALHLVRR